MELDIIKFQIIIWKQHINTLSHRDQWEIETSISMKMLNWFNCIEMIITST
jgi:hypothetical protein